MRVGINTRHPESRVAQMPAFGRDKMLDRAQVGNVAAYVYSLTHPDYSTPENIKRIEAGREVFLTPCAACHGENAKGNQELGAPNLTDAYWLYGGDRKDIYQTIFYSRGGIMPNWSDRLDEATIKQLAVYVHSLGGGQ